MGAQEKWDEAKKRAAKQEDIRKAVHELGESNSGNQAARRKKLIELAGSESKAEKAYKDYTGGGSKLAKFFGR